MSIKKEDLRIIFMGTPDFAVPSLKAIIEAGYNVVGVITSPDKPAGRGKKIKFSAIKTFALQHQLPVLQPDRLKNPGFLLQLQDLSADLQVVVAFRMLPEQVWNMPPLGTINLHASLLPQYRGAAPINHAIMNGEKETGLTTFILDKEIDTGKILLQTKIKIGDNENAGSLHDRMMLVGADLLIETIEKIRTGKAKPIEQDKLQVKHSLKKAPKIFKEDCKINWSQEGEILHNFIRGLSPFPGAYSYLISPEGDKLMMKIYQAKPVNNKNMDNLTPGSIQTDGKNYFFVKTKTNLLELNSIQIAGRKRMNAPDLLRGFTINNNWKFA